MSEIKFFTPVYYGVNAKSFEEKAIENIDNYFNICGKKAVVIPGRTEDGKEKVILRTSKFSTKTLFKIIGIALSIFTVIIPLVLLISKAILRSSHNYVQEETHKKKAVEISDNHTPGVEGDPVKEQEKETHQVKDVKKDLEKAKDELEKGFQIPLETIIKIQALMPKILAEEDNHEIKWLARGNNLVFKLENDPKIVFKLAKSNKEKGKIEERFENMIKAKEVCLANDLGLLVIPHAKKLEIGGNTIIAEESLDFNAEESVQEEFYHIYSKDLNETVRQLAIFIAKTGFNDVTPRNIPILNEKVDFRGSRRIALIDLEYMRSSINGFIGDANGSCGLLHCVSEEQIDIVMDEASKNGLVISDDNKQRRLQEIESDKGLKQYHINKGIVTGKEPINVDVNSLGLDGLEQQEEYKKGQTITLRNLTEKMINGINAAILESREEATLKRKRYVSVNISRYMELGKPDNVVCLSKEDAEKLLQTNRQLGFPDPINISAEEEKKLLWFHRITNALIEKGHIFKLAKVDPHVIWIQA